MARLSGALCMVLVTSSLLLMVLLLAAGPASAYAPSPPLDHDCYYTMKKCLRRACKCGWSLDWSLAQCGYNDMLAKSSEGAPGYIENDSKEEKQDPKGCPARGMPQVIHLPNLCHMVERSGLSLAKATSLKSGDSHENTYEFNHHGCQEYLADVCNIGSLYDLGYTTAPFSRAAHPSCRNCKSIAKMMARLICSPEHCFCSPKGEYTKPNYGIVHNLVTPPLTSFTRVDKAGYYLEKTYSEEHIMGCHCMETPQECEHGHKEGIEITAAAADVAAGK